MKKIILSLMLFVLLVPEVKAKTFTYEEYEKLDISHSYVVGDYLFDLSKGYTPSLKDFMHASRTIPKTKKVYIYEIMLINIPALNYYQFTMTEVYSNQKVTDKKNFYNFNAKYIYRNSIDGAEKGKDYEEIK